MESVSTDNYMIEKITGIAIDKDNKRYYKIQWAPSWENEENLIGCGELIKNFLLEQANNINVELQQKTDNTIKQEKVLRSINDVINNDSTSAVSGVNIKKEVCTSSSEENNQSAQTNSEECDNVERKLFAPAPQHDDNNQTIQNQSSTGDVNVSSTAQTSEADECDTIIQDIYDNSDVNMQWFDMINQAHPDSTSNASTVDVSTTTQTANSNSINKPQVVRPHSKKKVASNSSQISKCSSQSIKVLFQRDSIKNKDCIEEGFFKCMTCNKSFETFTSLQTHKKDHSYVASGPSCTSTTANNSNVKFEWNYSLQREITPKLLKTFKCAACTKTFHSSPLLKKHIKTHRGSLRCHHCSEVFLRYHSLNLHVMNVHTNDVGELLKVENDQIKSTPGI